MTSAARDAALASAAEECEILASLCAHFGEPRAAMRLRQAAQNIRDMGQEDAHEIAAAAIAKARHEA
jgi:hypothetical protein